MGEQKNLFLAIGLSVAIIIIFQFIFPQQSVMTPPTQDETKQIQPSTSIDQNQQISESIVKTKKEVLTSNNRVSIKTPSLQGSINLKGATLDDLILLNYNESLEKNSKNINLLSPEQTANPYYVELGWKSLTKESSLIQLPDLNTEWNASSTSLTPNSPITLFWTNTDNVTFKIHFEVDEDYLFKVTQEIENNSIKSIEVFPYRLIKRINFPDTINFFILHEGLISLLNDELLEKKYSHLADDCSTATQTKSTFCDQKATGGWLGFTDKYWMTVLIPDQNEAINANYRHSNNNNDNFRAGYAGQVAIIKPNTNHIYKGKIFAGAKVLKILKQYSKEHNIIRFDDAIDWGWFSFLTKPIFIAINWFYGLVGNFGIAIIAFTFTESEICTPSSGKVCRLNLALYMGIVTGQKVTSCKRSNISLMDRLSCFPKTLQVNQSQKKGVKPK